MVLGISFTHKKKNSSTDFLVKKALESAKAHGAETKFLKITDYNIIPCNGCGSCMNSNACPLLNDADDDAKKLYDECYAADQFIFGFPVYALAVPGKMINFFNRAPYVLEKDLEFDRYTYERCEVVKGKCFRGKVAALIGVATGLGHDSAMGNLFPAFTAMKLTVSISVGLSLMEYDSQPQVRKHPWAKNIEDADFALDMMRAVGKRILTSSTAFITEKTVIEKKDSRKTASANIIGKRLSSFNLKDLNEQVYSSDIFNGKNHIFIIGRGPDSRNGCDEWHSALKEKYHSTDKVELVRLVSISMENLPTFITPDFIKAQVKAFNKFPEDKLFFDWDDVAINDFRIIEGNFEPNVIILDKDLQVLYNYNGSFSVNAIEEIKKILD